MWKWLGIILLLVGMGLVPVGVLAATTQEVTVTATPGYGIVSFDVEYISDTQIDLSWAVAPDVTKVMVRAKFNEDLDDIPDENTAPSDGELVYYGDAGSASYWTNLETTSYPLYFKIWGQKADESWYTGSKSGWAEGTTMLLLAFFIFCGIMSFLSLRSTYYILKFLAGVCWWALCMYWINYAPASIADGSPMDTGMIVILFAIGVAFFFMPFWYSRYQDGREVGGRLRLPFMRTDEQDEEAKRQRSLPTRSERTSAYLDRLNNRTRGGR